MNLITRIVTGKLILRVMSKNEFKKLLGKPMRSVPSVNVACPDHATDIPCYAEIIFHISKFKFQSPEVWL